jgi:addiction module HigA family antidote
MKTRKTKVTQRRDIPPIHPGEVLAEDFLKPLGITEYRLAKETSVPPRRINLIVKGRQAITADTALRLGRYFGMEAQFWMNLQARYDLEVAEIELSKRLAREVTPRAAA